MEHAAYCEASFGLMRLLPVWHPARNGADPDASRKWKRGGVGKLLRAMPIALQGLDEQVATDRTRDAAYHVLPGIVAVLKVGRDSDGDTRGKTDPRSRECAGGRRSKPSCKSPRAWIVLHGTWG